MRKILFSIILVLMIIFTGYTVVRGIQIKNIDIWGIERIQIEDETINSANAELSDLASSKYTSSLKNLNNSAETMQKTKSEYESKALLLSDADRHMQTEQYEIEFLWTRIGNFAKDNDVDIKIEVTASQISGRYDLNFTIIGAYPDVTQFIYDIENDSKLGFKIEKFNMIADEKGVKATFSCTEIKINIDITNKTTTQSSTSDDINMNRNTTGRENATETNSTNTSATGTNSTNTSATGTNSTNTSATGTNSTNTSATGTN